MILDSISNLSQYVGLHSGLDRAIQLISQGGLSTDRLGKHETENSSVFYLVQSYETKPMSEVSYEAHRRYIDLQWVIKGCEWMSCAPVDTLQTLTEYDETHDIQFLSGDGNIFSVNEGQFAVFFPKDGHRPGTTIATPESVMKMVFKIEV